MAYRIKEEIRANGRSNYTIEETSNFEGEERWVETEPHNSYPISDLESAMKIIEYLRGNEIIDIKYHG